MGKRFKSFSDLKNLIILHQTALAVRWSTIKRSCGMINLHIPVGSSLEVEWFAAQKVMNSLQDQVSKEELLIELKSWTTWIRSNNTSVYDFLWVRVQSFRPKLTCISSASISSHFSIEIIQRMYWRQWIQQVLKRKLKNIFWSYASHGKHKEIRLYTGSI